MPQVGDNTQQFLLGIKNSLSQRLQNPYHINLLEEVHIHDDSGNQTIRNDRRRVCENAHTRILKKFVEFRSDGHYPILKSLLESISKETGKPVWSTIQVESPVFTPEANCCNTNGRIDLLVAEQGKYAIIFENKINDAVEQKSQLARYIEHLITEGYRREQIYVIYLSSEGRDPNEISWTIENRDYALCYRERFVNMSYKYNLLPWLSGPLSQLLSGMQNQEYLNSALSQYINYLQAKFFLLENENETLRIILEESFPEGGFNQLIHNIDSKIDDVLEYCEHNEEAGTDLLTTAKKTKNGLENLKKDKLYTEVNVGGFQRYTKGIHGRNNYIGYAVSINEHPYVIYIGDNKRIFFLSIIDLNNSGSLLDDCRSVNLLPLFPIRKPDQREPFLYTVITRGVNKQNYDYEQACALLRQALQRLL